MRNNQWIPLESLDQLEKAIEKSKEHPVILFKHSTRCSVSHFVEKNLDNNWSEYSDQAEFYWLDLIKYRNVSNAIADRFGVQHESPQIVFIKDEKLVDHASHQQIDLEKIMATA